MKLHLVCGNDNVRPNIDRIYIRWPWAYATDAHIILKFHMPDIVLPKGYLQSTEALQEEMDGKQYDKDDWQIWLRDMKKKPISFPEPLSDGHMTKEEADKWVNTMLNVFPDLERHGNQTLPEVQFFDVKLLNTLCQAVGQTVVRMAQLKPDYYMIRFGEPDDDLCKSHLALLMGRFSKETDWLAEFGIEPVRVEIPGLPALSDIKLPAEESPITDIEPDEDAGGDQEEDDDITPDLPPGVEAAPIEEEVLEPEVEEVENTGPRGFVLHWTKR